MKKRDLISLIVVIVVAIGAIWGIWYISSEPVTPTKEKEVAEEKKELEEATVGMNMKLGGFWPKCEYISTNLYVNFHIYGTLVIFDKEGKLKANLAEYWTNPDDLTWNIHLRKGVKFHNGDELKAEDVKFSIEETLKEENNFPNRENIGGVIDKVEIAGPYEIKIVTKKPYPILLNKMTDAFIFSKDYIEKNGYEIDPMGTGSYKFVKWEKEKEIVMERFEDYFGEKPAPKKIIFKPIEDHDKRIEALKKGEIDIAVSLESNDLEDLEKAEGVRPTWASTNYVTYIGIDIDREDTPGMTIKNPFQKLEVRKALTYGIDKQKVVDEIFKGKGEIASQWVSPEIFGYNPEIKPYSYDPSKAKKLLEEAGYPDGFKVVVDVPSGTEDPRAMKVVKEQLAKIGIDFEIKEMPRKEAFEKIIGGESTLYCLAWLCASMDAGEILDYLLVTPQPEKKLGIYNLGGYSNERIDELTKLTSETMDQKKRLSYMQEAMEIAMEEVAIIPLYYRMEVAGVSDKIEWSQRYDSFVYAWEIFPR